jgi:drug/metabolite transporter (DMT)-like permease
VSIQFASTAARQAASGEARRQRNSLGLAAGALIGAIAGILVVYKTKPGSTVSLIALFAAPLLAGVSITIIRTVLDDGSEWLKTALLGLGAGVIASLLFIASQLITSSTALQDKGVKTLVVLVTAVGFVAGITFDAVYKKLRQQDVIDTGALGHS